MDQMVLETQQWLNKTYGADSRFKKVKEDGQTGWPTVHGLTRALQIELGIQQTADNFGNGTQSRFQARYPDGVQEQNSSDNSTSNIYEIIQGALWCKGYSTGSHITPHFYNNVGKAILALKNDMGFGDGSTVDLEIMKALLSMKQFVLLNRYGGKNAIRYIQQNINRDYRRYTGIIPTDGIYGREMNKALIQVLQAIEGFTPAEATGNFGVGTRSRLKTINPSNASANKKWVWLGSIALLCNGYGEETTYSWDSEVEQTIRRFQADYVLPSTGRLDLTTWMSLLTSKGDPNRKALACDTRFEVTGELLTKFKSDGYEIVGRYLTEPGQANKKPEEYFKAIRPGELKRITEGGLKFFPIFQENSRQLDDFTLQNGARHAREARIAAQRLDIPSTYIYFAVDMDVLDYQIDSHILPYFRSILDNLGGGYRVGIYASRNVCSRVIKAGCAGSAFVSDMSSGFSGNLGFPIPSEWNYDQFAEIKGYGGQWDLDKVAHSGRSSAVSYTQSRNIGDINMDTSTDYLKLPPIDLIWHFEKRFEELRGQGKVGVNNLIDPGSGKTNKITVPTFYCILNYLAKSYLRDGGNLSTFLWEKAAEPFRYEDALALEKDGTAKKIIVALDRYIGGHPQNMIDANGGQVDLAHLSATILGYMSKSIIPSKWTGWAGDLASGMKNLQRFKEWNPDSSLQAAAESLVGHEEDYLQTPGLAGKITRKGDDAIRNTCNYSDLCSDGDAIALKHDINANDKKDPHALSKTIRIYYNNKNVLANRFKEIAWTVHAHNQNEAAKVFHDELTETGKNSIREMLSGKFDKDIIQSMCEALAKFIF